MGHSNWVGFWKRFFVCIHHIIVIDLVAANHCFLFSELKAPIAILGAEVDRISPPELLKKFEEVLSSKAEVCQIPVLHTRFQDQRTIYVSSELFAISILTIVNPEMHSTPIFLLYCMFGQLIIDCATCFPLITVG